MPRILLLILIAGVVFYFVTYHSDSGIAVGDAVPGFALSTVEGRAIGPDDFPGQVLLINFWATWCVACVQEMPSLNRLAMRMRTEPFRIIAVSEDGEGGGGWPAIRAFQQRVPMDFLVVLDPDGHVADRYGTFGIPESYLVDQRGKLVRKVGGRVDWDSDEMVAVIEGLL